MAITPITSFTGKVPNVDYPKNFQQAMENLLGHSDRDYINLSKKNAPKKLDNNNEFVLKAKEFFSSSVNAIKEFLH